MTFELQHADIPQAKLLDADPVTDKWPLPARKAWSPAFDLDRLCDEARERLAVAAERAAFDAWLRHCQKFGIVHRMHVSAEGVQTILVTGDPWPSDMSAGTAEWLGGEAEDYCLTRVVTLEDLDSSLLATVSFTE